MLDAVIAALNAALATATATSKKVAIAAVNAAIAVMPTARMRKHSDFLQAPHQKPFSADTLI